MLIVVSLLLGVTPLSLPLPSALLSLDAMPGVGDVPGMPLDPVPLSYIVVMVQGYLLSASANRITSLSAGCRLLSSSLLYLDASPLLLPGAHECEYNYSRAVGTTLFALFAAAAAAASKVDSSRQTTCCGRETGWRRKEGAEQGRVSGRLVR